MPWPGGRRAVAAGAITDLEPYLPGAGDRPEHASAGPVPRMRPAEPLPPARAPAKPPGTRLAGQYPGLFQSGAAACPRSRRTPAHAQHLVQSMWLGRIPAGADVKAPHPGGAWPTSRTASDHARPGWHPRRPGLGVVLAQVLLVLDAKPMSCYEEIMVLPGTLEFPVGKT